jgi:UDP-glucose 4-epimerase
MALMRILVTGGAGYIGSVISARLVARGHEVTVYDDLSRGHRAAVPAGAALVTGDILDQDALTAALRVSVSQSIVHMAALSEVGESFAEERRYREVNVAGTAAVISAARACGARRLVFSSSAAVYGAPTRVPIEEDAPLAPTNPYGETKLAAEGLLAAAARSGDLVTVALRYFNAAGADGAYGEDHRPESHLIPLALRAVRDGEPQTVFGDDYPTPDGTCLRDYVHVVDLAEAHIAALTSAASGVFNLGTGRGDSVLDVLAAVERFTGKTVGRRVAPRRRGDPPALVASFTRAARELGWRPLRSLDAAVCDAGQWLDTHPDGYED